MHDSGPSVGTPLFERCPAGRESYRNLVVVFALVLDLFDLVFFGERRIFGADAAGVIVAGAFGVDGEHRDELLQLGALAGGAGGRGGVFQDEGLEALRAVKALVVVNRHVKLF